MVSETRGCAFCGAENPSDAKFCQGCGRALHAAESASGPASGQVVIRVPQELTAVELWLAAIGWYMVIQAVLLVGGALVCLLGGGLTLVAQKQVQELLPGGGFGAGLMERPGGFLIFAGLFFSVLAALESTAAMGLLRRRAWAGPLTVGLVLVWVAWALLAMAVYFSMATLLSFVWNASLGGAIWYYLRRPEVRRVLEEG